MLRRVRDKLRMIRYYSATRPRSNWNRAADVAFVASFLAAVPAAWLCDVIMIRPAVAFIVNGQLFRTDGGSITAIILDPDSRGEQITPQGSIHGSFELTVEDRQRGWPLITSVHRLPPR